jgi:hypothetical protein
MSNHSEESKERFIDLYPRLIGFMSDNRNGVSPEKNAQIKKYMDNPRVASAIYQSLMAQDLSNFDPNSPCPFSPEMADLFRSYFPEA